MLCWSESFIYLCSAQDCLVLQCNMTEGALARRPQNGMYWSWEERRGRSFEKSMDHPSWSRLTQPQRRALRKHHLRRPCLAFPVSCETDAMLDPAAPCFLVNHPNMRFKISIQWLPGVFTMQYPSSTVHVHPSRCSWYFEEKIGLDGVCGVRRLSRVRLLQVLWKIHWKR